VARVALSDRLSGLELPLAVFFDLKTSLNRPTGDGDRCVVDCSGVRLVRLRLGREPESTDSDRFCAGNVDDLGGRASSWLGTSGRCVDRTIGDDVVR
jgi:hypothetical protein